MNTIFKKYPKEFWDDPDIRPLIDREYYIYCKYILDMSTSCHKAEGASHGMKKLSIEIRKLIKQKQKENE